MQRLNERERNIFGVGKEVIEWMQERFCIKTNGKLAKKAVYDEYQLYCRSNGYEPVSASACGRMMHKGLLLLYSLLLLCFFFFFVFVPLQLSFLLFILAFPSLLTGKKDRSRQRGSSWEKWASKQGRQQTEDQR